MFLIYSFIVLFVFPTSSWAFSCRYNESAVILRKTILLELEDHNYIHIYDATFDITPKSKSIESASGQSKLTNKNFHLIEDISFKGYLAKGDESEYIEVILNNLKSFRTHRDGDICRVSYHEAKSEGLNITSEQEAAITRLAESCIQSIVCGIDLMEIDVDSDLYYQSTQSALNELVDFYVPKVLKMLLDNDGNLQMPMADISESDISLYVKSGVIKGINTLQRANDVVVKHEKSKYTVNLVVRFAELNVFLNHMKAKYKLFATSGDLKGISQGVSLKTNVVIDLQPSACKVSIDNLEMVSFKNIKLYIPVWGWFTISYNLNSDNLWFFERAFLSYVIQSIPEFNINCEEYLNQFDQLIM